MGRKCVVPNCKSGYASSAERVSLFHVPKDDELRAKWVKAIPPTRIPITSTHAVCEKHFVESNIERAYIHRNENGHIIANVAYLHPRLKKAAVPSIFEPKSGHEFQKDISAEQSWRLMQLEPNIDTGINSDIKCDTKRPVAELNSSLSAIKSEEAVPLRVAVSCEKICSVEDLKSEKSHIENKDSRACSENSVWKPEGSAKPSPSLKKAFIDLYSNAMAINIPHGWFRYTSSGGDKFVAFSTFGKKSESNSVQPLARKSVLILECGEVHASANGKTIPCTNICRSLESISSVQDLSRFLKTFATVGLCGGIQLADDPFLQFRVLFQDPFGQWRHKDCFIVSNNRTCNVCKKLRRLSTQRKRRLNRDLRPKETSSPYNNLQEWSKLIALRKRLRSQRETIRRAGERIKRLKDAVVQAEVRNGSLNKQSIINKCKELKYGN